MDQNIKNRLAKLSDQELVAIWLASADPEHPTTKEIAALELMEERNIDF